MAKVASNWTDQEDERLRDLIDEHGAKRWSLIASLLGSKGSKQCRRRWKNVLNAELKKGGWSKDEDQILLDGHRIHGNKWTEIARMVGGRTDNAVKNRWAALCKRTGKPPKGGDSSGGSGGRAGSATSAGVKASAGGGEGLRQAARRTGAVAARKKWEVEELSDDEDEDEDEDEVSGSEDSDDGAARARQQRRWRQQQQQQQQRQQAASAAAAASAKAKAPPPQPLSIPPSDMSCAYTNTSSRRSPRHSPTTLASAVGVARSVLASTGVAGLFQPLHRLASGPQVSRLNPGFHTAPLQHDAFHQPAVGALYPGMTHDLQGPGGAAAGGGCGAPYTDGCCPGAGPPRLTPQQVQFQKWAGHTVMDLGDAAGRQSQQLGYKRHHSSIEPQGPSGGMGEYGADGCGAGGAPQQAHCYSPSGKRQAVVRVLPPYADVPGGGGGDGDPFHVRPRRSPRIQPANGHTHGDGHAQRQGQGQGGGAWQQHAAGGSSPSGGSGGTSVRPRTSPTTPLMSALAEAGRRSHSGSELLDAQAAQLPSPASVRGAVAAAAFASACASPVAAVKKPPGLCISIPHGPEADPTPGAGAAVNYRIQVHAERLTPAERRQVGEINQLDLPVQIQVCDEPPLTSCRRGMQQSLAALASSAAAAPGEGLADSMDSPAGMDWIAKLLDSECQPGLSPGSLGAVLGQGQGQASSPSPRRPTTRAMLRGSPGALRGSPSGRRQEDTAAAVAARALAAHRDQQQQQQEGGGKDSVIPSRVADPNGASLSPSAASLVNGLARGGLQDGHKQLLTRLLTGAKATEEVLTRAASPGGCLGRTPDAPDRTLAGWDAPASPLKQACSAASPGAPAPAVNGRAAAAPAAAADVGRGDSEPRPAFGIENLVSPGRLSDILMTPRMDVLLTPQLPVDDLNSILEFLGNF